MSRSHARIAQDGDHVQLVIDGRGWRIPAAAALELGRNLVSEAKRAEEVVNANRVIADAAILLRSGAPFGITNNRKIYEDAKTMAQWDSSVRRYMDANFRKTEVGTPALQHEVRR